MNGDETIQKLSATFGVRRHVAALQSADMSAHSKGAAGDYDRVIMRALGPELTNFGVPKALTNPTLELHNSAGAVIASKYNWQQTIIGGIITSNQVSEIMALDWRRRAEESRQSSQSCYQATTPRSCAVWTIPPVSDSSKCTICIDSAF